MNLSSALVFGVRGAGSKSVGPVTARDSLVINNPIYLDSGTSADQADQQYHVSGSLTASTTSTIDVMGGLLTDAFGDALALARIKAVYVQNTGTVTLNLSGTNGIVGGGTIPVRAGGAVLIVATDATGYVATAGSADTITLANPSGSTAGAYVLVIIGATA